MLKRIACRWVGAICCLSLWAVAACGPPGGGEDGSSSISVDEANEQVTTAAFGAACSAGFECAEKQTPRTVASVSRYGDSSTCRSKFSMQFQSGDTTETKEDIEAGLVEYDGNAAADCVEKIESYYDSNTCIGLLGANFDFESCRNAFQGTQGNGDPCTSDDQCESGYCDQSKNTEKCYGACAEDPTEIVGAGEPCGEESDNICDPEKNLSCSRSDDAEQRVCVEWRSVDEGGSCGSGIVCSGDLACVDGKCVQTTLKAEDESCAPQDATVGCEPGLICNLDLSGSATGEGTCTPPLGQGDECYATSECKWNLYCAGADLTAGDSGTCEETKSEGSDCESLSECEGALECSDGTCSPPADEEESCSLPSEMEG